MATQEVETAEGKIYSRIIKHQSARENNSAMASKTNTTLILSGAFLLIMIVCGSVVVARVITNDDLIGPVGPEGPMTSAKIVKNIRNVMNDTTVVSVPIQAYIIPSVDAHQSEYIAESDRRMEYVTSFTGSNGMAVIAENTAAFWTDSRYYLQAEQQLDNETWTLMKAGKPEVPTIEEWLVNGNILPANSRVGIDPFLIEAAEFRRMSEYLSTKGHKMVAIQQNLVDLVWKNRPVLTKKPLEKLDYRFSGKRAFQKVKEVREAIEKLEAECLIVTTLDDIAWLFNIRGSDIEANPVFFSYAIVTLDELYLYVLDKERINYNIENHFNVEKIDVLTKEYNTTLVGINSVIRATTGKVILSKVSEAIQSIVPTERRLITDNPIVLMKVIKNDVEASGIQSAHLRDGVALVRYLHWLDHEIDVQNITEISGAEKLAQFRSQQEHFRGLSFQTISAVGAHAALVHYSPTLETDKRITRKEIYLVDSGGQYLDGTTDVTRTIHLGTPTPEEKDAFTRVLKGFISLGTAIFPSKAPYSFFDAMARRALWDVGLDYGHGTGHGIGAYLNVHEYPPLISSRNTEPGMLKNMFTSNEPGYYASGKFGIRIESIIQVIDAPDTEKYFDGRGALKFSDITMAPIQTKLIDVDLLTKNEIAWLNEYHENVRKNLMPLLGDDSNVIEWLRNQTQPIGPNANITNGIEVNEMTKLINISDGNGSEDTKLINEGKSASRVQMIITKSDDPRRPS